MTQEALKQMYQLLLTEPHAPTVCAQLESIAREALAEHAMRETQRLGQEIEQEPVGTGMVYYKNDACKAKDAYADDCICWTKAQPPQRTEQEPVAWPCLIDSADFSKGTITVVMQCNDYKVSAGTHWLSTTPPKETT